MKFIPPMPFYAWAALLGAPILETAPAIAQAARISLGSGFTPNPTVVQGTGGGTLRAAEVVGVRRTPTGPCLGYVRRSPHQRLTLTNDFSDLELHVTSDTDTTLIVEGPGGIWCNDDSDGHNPVIRGEWLPGDYSIWVGAYRPQARPSYELSIRDRAR